MLEHELYMRRCLELADFGRFTAAPNPLVGAVIVHNGTILGEGYHHHPGGPHAEVVAINKVKDHDLLKEACLYVNLEPCSHFGRTPPCSDLIIKKGIPKVIIGSGDSNNVVNGKGIEKLRNAGIEVIEGVLEEESRFLNRKFFTFHTENRPYITLKFAQSSDKIMDPYRASGEKGVQWISSPESQVFSHRLRAENQAILVGRKTVEIDDPSLDCRAFKAKNPMRLVLDPNSILASNCKVFRDDNYRRFSHKAEKDNDRVIHAVKPFIHQVLDHAVKDGLQSILVEGGRATLGHFINSNLWDEAYVIESNTILVNGLKSPEFTALPSRKWSLGNDTIYNYFSQ